ncbi:MAG TPA: lamin tail domain-containing protein [Verrucomicrobiae bacterium]|nr:lamin tail domain-containing protein [Verrucomicrobiae bacterium]
MYSRKATSVVSSHRLGPWESWALARRGALSPSPTGRAVSPFPRFAPAPLLRITLLALTLSVVAHRLSAQQTVITNGATWRWSKGTNEVSNPITAWRTNGFNDSTWLIGPAPFHFGNLGATGDDGITNGTLLPDMRNSYRSVFLRRPFVITNVAEIQSVSLTAMYDDGFIAWINGQEVARINVNGQPTYLTNATQSIEPCGTNTFVAGPPPASYLATGSNVLAVQAFNNTLSGSDLRFDTTLVITKFGVPPVITNVVPAPGASLSGLTQVAVFFSKPVSGVDASDLQLNEVPASSVIGAPGTNRYTFTFTQPPAGVVGVTWSESPGITDLAGAAFDQVGPNATWSYTLADTAPPVATAVNPVNAAQVSQLTQVEVTFSEPVFGVNAADLRINGVSAANVTGAEAGPYVFTFPQPAAGGVNLSWAAGHGITDFASNAFAGAGWSVTLNPSVVPGNVIINEIVAGNLTGLMDEDGERPDWIEIHNRGATAVNLLGWSLTDNPDVPGQWTFPSTILSPGQYLVVFASGKDRRSPLPGNRYHTNFKLNLFGDYVALFNPESPRVAASEFEFPEQRNDYSYGLDQSAAAWRYFQVPTPGAANGSSPITSVLPTPHFSVERGFFDAPFNLLLTTPVAGATIRYTEDGSEPTLSNGQTYTAPIQISATATIRAVAFANNYLPSRVSTHSYIYLDTVLAQPNNPAGFPGTWGTAANFPGNIVPADYEMDSDPLRENPYDPFSAIDPIKLQRFKDGMRELPTLSVVLNRDDMFGPNGLYPRSTSGNKTSNEKAVSVEMLLPDGTTAFTIDGGLDLHGNASRDPFKTPKHGFKLEFKGDYGETSLEYPLFPESPAEKFDDLILRPDFGVSWLHWSDNNDGLGAFQRTRASRFRDAWMKHSQRDMGGPASFNRYVHLFINGLYWGVYDISEQPNGQFAENYFAASTDGYDIYDQGALTTSAGGNSVAYNAMLAINGLNTNANYELMKQYLNVTEFSDYMLLNFLAGAQDWGVNKNWYAIRPRVNGTDGRFQYVVWDGENTLMNETINRVPNGGGNIDLPSGLFPKLDDNAQFRLDFADRVHKHMIAPDGPLTTEANIARWQYWQGLLDNAIVAESCRWGDYRRDVHPYQNGVFDLYTRENQWLVEMSRMANSYFINRHGIVLDQLRTAGLYPTLNAPEFREGSVGGDIIGNRTVAAGYVVALNNPDGVGTVYCTTNGVDPRVYYSGLVAAGVLTNPAPLTLNNSVTLKARVLNGATWSALNEATFIVGELGVPLRITEIMYNPIGGDAYEFIEVQNIGSLPLNVGLFSFQGMDFTFPEGTILQPSATVLLANNANPAQFAVRYPGVVVFGYYGGSLMNSGERIGIVDGNGNNVTAVHYDDQDGWPTSADGGGFSLEIIDPRGDPNTPANWRASSIVNGTPGLPPVAPASSSVVINEIAADNAGSVTNGGLFPDWVELRNLGASPTNLAGWSLTDNGNARQFVFPPDTIINPGGYLVVWCDTAIGAPGLHAGFALSKNGETISLFDANTNRMDAVTFGLQLTDATVGRLGNEWTLTVPTPNAPNSAAPLAPATNLVINEWLASPGAGGQDWIELFNRSVTSPAALAGLYLGTSNTTFHYTALSFVPPLGHVQLFADELPGADQLEFKLPAAGGAIRLYSSAATLLDSVNYGAQVTGVSEGRLPSGSPNIAAFPGSVSPGVSNYVLVWNGPVLNEVLARNDRAVISPWGSAVDFVELFNPGGSPVSLGGMGLGESTDFAAAWKFPVGASIPAGGHLVIWCDGDRAPSTSAAGPHNTGFSLAGEGGAVVLFNTAGQAVNSVGYGFQVDDQSIGLVAGNWRLLATPTPGVANSAAASLGSPNNLRFNEWMAAPLPLGGDWFELYNAGTLPVELSGLYLSDSPAVTSITNSPIAPLSFIEGKKWVLFMADGLPGNGRDHANFSLAQGGETLRLYDTNLTLLTSVDFGWQNVNVSQGLLPDGATNIASFPATATPGDANYLPVPGLIINEVLTHTDPPLEDAVELFNSTANPIDIGGWYLSDSQSDLKRYRIPDGTIVPAGGFKVFYQYQFGPADGESDIPPLFSFNSAHGDGVYLSEVDSGQNLTGYRLSQSFDAAANGVSFGPHQTSVGVHFVPLSARTFGVDNPTTLAQFRSGTGQTNVYPLVGPVVINEIMYHPPDYGTNSPDIEEFIELLNITNVTVALYDPLRPTNVWRLANGVNFSFATNQTIPAGGRLLVVGFNPANTTLLNAFRARYGTTGDVVGPFSGQLANSGETLELWRPDVPQTAPPEAGFVPQLLVERIAYTDLPPWPTSADGQGASLQRIVSLHYGNDPVNWKAAAPTAGTTNASVTPPVITSQPQSRSVHEGETATFTTAATGEGVLSYQWLSNNVPLAGQTASELVLTQVKTSYAATYNVQVSNSGGSVLSAPATLTVSVPPTGSVTLVGTTFARVSFSVVAGRTYQLEYRNDLTSGTWLPLGSPRLATGTVLITNDSLGPTQRFYRLRILP